MTMADDFSDDILTTGILAVEGPSTPARFDFDGDVDWFRVELEQFTSYLFDIYPKSGNEQINYEIRIYDSRGVEFPFYRADNTAHRIFAFSTGTYFVGVSYQQPYVDVIDYQVHAALATQDAGQFGGDILAYTHYFSGTVAPGDSDILTMPLAPAATYEFEVFGSDTRNDRTLVDPHLRITANHGYSVSDDNSGSGRDAYLKLTDTPFSHYPYQIEVSGSNDAFGSYLIRVKAKDDHVTGPRAQTTINLPTNGTGIGKGGALELSNDIDWLRLPLKKGDIVIFSLGLSGTNAQDHVPIYGVTDSQAPNWYIADIGGYNHDQIFVAHETRDYFVVVKNRSRDEPYVGAYTVSSWKEVVPQLTWYGSHYVEPRFVEEFDVGSFNGFQLDDYDNRTRDFQSGVQLYSADPFVVGGVSYPANQVIPFDEARFDVEFEAGNREIFFRNTAVGMPITDWNSLTRYVVGPETMPGFDGKFDQAFLAKKEFTFAFADTRPDYLDGETWGNGFEPLSTAQREVMRRAIAQWDLPLQVTFTEVDPATMDPGDIDTLIYFTEHDEWFINPDSNAQNLYDIVLNKNRDIYQNPVEGTRGFYELLRTVGKAMGAIENPTFNREESLFGLRYNPEIYSELFPSTPTYYDLMRASYFPNQMYGYLRVYGEDTYLNREDSTYRLDGDPFVKTIMDFGGSQDEIDASQQSLPVTIDLRPGGVSYSGSYQNRPHTYYTGLSASLTNATGGSGFDYLSGNGLQNVLRGGNGNDHLIGRKQDDFLFGGAGNDTYEYRQSDGNDRIFEAGAGGNDTLTIWGVNNLDDLPEDLKFRRDQNDLIISLDYDNLFGERSEEITIVNFAHTASRVETLRLSNMYGEWGVVSLPSIFANANENPASFRISQNQDSFGSIAVRV